MLKSALVLFATLGVTAAHADQQAAAIYYKGEQPAGIAGDVVDCFVEAAFSADGLEVELRALVAEPHDLSEVVGLGPISAAYNAEKSEYSYIAPDDHDEVQKATLKASTPGSAEGLSLVVLDGSHVDKLVCGKLATPVGEELAAIEEKFEHFDDHTGDDDHDDDDDHDHDHDHP